MRTRRYLAKLRNSRPAAALLQEPVGGQLRPLLIALAALLALSSVALGAERRERPGAGDDRLLDVRDGARAPVSAATRSAQRRLLRRLGGGGVLRVAPTTGTTRLVTDLRGTLTRRSSLRPAALTQRFMRDQRGAYGLTAGEAGALEPEHEYRSREGITYVRLRQTHRGVPAFDGSVTAAVRDGRLLSVAGAPQPDLAVRSVRPRLSSSRARDVAQRDAGLGRGAGRPKLVLFNAPEGTRLAWSLLVFADRERVLSTVVDAATGRTLRRANLVRRADTGRALDYNPSTASGSTYQDKSFSAYVDNIGALSNTRLRGNFAWTYADENATDDTSDTPNPGGGQQIPPSSGAGTPAADWTYPPTTEGANGEAGRSCPSSGCTWNLAPVFPGSVFPLVNSHQINRNQVGTQTHYYVSRFHDHLLAAPISFDAASGNFEGVDRVHAQINDGAGTGPVPAFRNNASMFTPADGSPPIMEMFLFGGSGAHDVNGGDDAQVVLHEYTHGLSNRLVCCDINGNGQLNSDQSGAMGESWSDWYMFDYVEAAGFQADTAAPGELVQGGYENVDFVSEASDCPVGTTSINCPNGGYTYGDFGNIPGAGGPEVHADGEIWTQTLWDLRRRLIATHGRADGITRARRLITGAMRRSPGEPDFLDMRDAILATDSQLQGGSNRTLIRQVFAARGMGGCAQSDSGLDSTPTESFSTTGCSFSDAPPVGGGAGSGGGDGGGGTTGTTQPRLLSDIGFGGFPGRRTSLRRVLRRGLRGRVSCNADCGFRAELVLPRRSARKARIRGRVAVVSRVRASDAAGGSGRAIRFRFSRRTAAKLRRLTRGTVVEVRVTATDTSGTRRVEKKKLRLTR